MMTRFSDALASCLQEDTWQGYLLRHWHEIVGDLSTRICLERIKGDTLFIGVHDVHWMHELFCLGQEIMSHINSQLVNAPVKQVRFVLSSRHRPKKKYSQPHKAPATSAPAIVTQASAGATNVAPRGEKLLNDRQRHALAQIADPQLQEIIRQLMIRGT